MYFHIWNGFVLHTAAYVWLTLSISDIIPRLQFSNYRKIFSPKKKINQPLHIAYVYHLLSWKRLTYIQQIITLNFFKSFSLHYEQPQLMQPTGQKRLLMCRGSNRGQTFSTLSFCESNLLIIGSQESSLLLFEYRVWQFSKWPCEGKICLSDHYWLLLLLKYSPCEAIHFVRQYCHSWKHSWTSFPGILLSNVVTFWCLSFQGMIQFWN